MKFQLDRLAGKKWAAKKQCPGSKRTPHGRIGLKLYNLHLTLTPKASTPLLKNTGGRVSRDELIHIVQFSRQVNNFNGSNIMRKRQ